MLNITASKIILDLPIDAMIMCTKEQKRLAKDSRATPHITLGMGILDYSNFDRVRKVMNVIARQSRRIDVTIIALKSAAVYQDDRTIAYYELELNKKLWELHMLVMKHIQPYIWTETVNKSMFWWEEPVSDETLRIVQEYWEKYAFKNRTPMIELWVWVLSPLPRKEEFVSKRISLWKVWNNAQPTKEMFGLFLGGGK